MLAQSMAIVQHGLLLYSRYISNVHGYIGNKILGREEIVHTDVLYTAY